MVAPVPVARYLVAYGESSRPAGMAESAMLSDIYGSYATSPNALICDLQRYCPIEEMATMRTVYAAPEVRGSSSLFLALTLASAKLFRGLGARYATATTGSSAHHLKKLYLKYGGDLAGEGDVGGVDITLFVFDLEHLLRHRAFHRVASSFDFEHDLECLAA